MTGVTQIAFRGRSQLPDRRPGTNVEITHKVPNEPGRDRKYSVTFGFDPKTYDVREIFIWPQRTGADLDAVITDACIGISHALQRGASIADLASAFGQLRPEGAPDGEYPPASPLGTILRAGIEIERLEKREQRVS